MNPKYIQTEIEERDNDIKYFYHTLDVCGSCVKARNGGHTKTDIF